MVVGDHVGDQEKSLQILQELLVHSVLRLRAPRTADRCLYLQAASSADSSVDIVVFYETAVEREVGSEQRKDPKVYNHAMTLVSVTIGSRYSFAFSTRAYWRRKMPLIIIIHLQKLKYNHMYIGLIK